jgi:AraC family transcriptional regulator
MKVRRIVTGVSTARWNLPPCQGSARAVLAMPRACRGLPRRCARPLCRHHHVASNPSAIDVQRGATSPCIAVNSSSYKGYGHEMLMSTTISSVVQISPPDAVSRRGESWTGMAGEIVQVNRRGRINFHFRAPVHMLAMYERSVRYEGRTLIQGLPQSTLRDCSRKLVFVPAGHEYHDWHEPRTLPRVAFFYFNAARLVSSPEPGFSGISMSFAPQLFFEDSALWDTALKLNTLIENDESDNRLYLEALGTVLAHELARWHMGRRCAEAQVRGGLLAWQRRTITDYIEEHLVEPISLAELAQLVRLSPNYFCRAFSQSFGMPLHRYHSRQRIERAKTLLAKAGCSVTDVGLTVGYREASAFSTAFRRVTGLAPSSYRRTLR